MEKDLKNPPNNTEAERAVLGSILLDTAGGDEDRVMDLCLTSGVSENSFYDTRNRTIFGAMRALNASGKPLDAVSLLEALRTAGTLEAVGGVAYVQALVDQTPTAAHAEHYIGIVHDKEMRRTMIDRATKVMGRCYDEGQWPDPQAVLGYAEKSFLEIGENSSTTKAWDQAIDASFAAINRMFTADGNRLEGLSTGLRYLDEKLQGLKKAEMIVIAARPSVGKTSLAMNIAECVALGRDLNNEPIKSDNGKRHPVLIFSLEMPVDALTKRMIAGRAQLNMWKLNRNLVPKSERDMMSQNLFQATGDLRDAPIYVDDAAGLDIMDLRARARRQKKAHGIELIVIDYLQLCTCHEAARQANRQIEVSMISQQIKAMAKELNIPVIVLSQLSRANEQRGDKSEKPKLSDLRDSGAIEQDADVVFLLRRPSRISSDKESDDKTLAIIDVAKNRNGETGEVRVNFFAEFTRFGDRAPESKNVTNFTSSEEAPEGPASSRYRPVFVQDPLA